MIKSVVTDDQGRYLVPDLPKATYDVWVRGYGLIDSPKVKAAPGKAVNLTAIAAPDKKQRQPTIRLSIGSRFCNCRRRAIFPEQDPGQRHFPTMRSQGEWIRQVVNTDGCTGCHQLGNEATRTIPKALGTFEPSVDAWDRRIQAGQAGGA